jgi:hypothetical protein
MSPFLRPEAGATRRDVPPGPDLNGDGDARTKSSNCPSPVAPAENLQCSATAVSLSRDWLAALVSEAGEGATGTDPQRRRDRTDDVVALHRVADGEGACSAPILAEPPPRGVGRRGIGIARRVSSRPKQLRAGPT